MFSVDRFCFEVWRRSLSVFMLVTMALGLGSCGSREVPLQDSDAAKSEDLSRPNVVWILLDTLRSDHLGAYGYERETSPNIDGLAERGVLFERHFSQGPNTIFSVPTYFSGKFFPVFLQDEHHLDAWFLKERPKDEVLASELFSRNGYTTGMFSSSPWYSERSRLGSSFGHFSPLVPPTSLTTSDYRVQNPGLFEWIDENKDVPFFAYIHTLDAHEPRGDFNTRDTWLEEDFPGERGLELRKWIGAPFGEEDQEYIRGLYDGGVAYADYTVGEILSHLETLGILENTVVIISSDHGEILGTDGATLGHPSKGYADELFRVPFIIAGPGLPEGGRFAQRSRNVDILPTLVELLDLEHDAHFDGVSLMPVIAGNEEAEVPAFIYTKSEDLFFFAEPRHILYGESARYMIAGTRDGGVSKSSAQLERGMDVSALTGFEGELGDTAELKGAAKYLEETILPGWERYIALPVTVPAAFQLSHVDVLMKEVLTEAVDAGDGLWTREVIGDPFTPSSSVRYVAFNDTEQVPRMGNVCKVPGGRYRISILASTYAVDGIERASSFRLNTESPENFHLYRLEPESSTKRRTKWMDLGEFDLPKGIFYYHIEAGLKGDVSAFGGFRFQDLNQEEQVEIDVERVEEELRSVGYLE